jgi:hypothetical protein
MDPNRNEQNSRSESSTANAVQNTSILTKDVISSDPRIRLVDRDEETGLELYCYNQCDPKDDELLKRCRGVVFHQDTVVLKAFPYTNEYSNKDPDLETVIEDLSDWSFYDSYEGALLRMFYFNNRWFLSTHRKLDAFQSKWSSRDSFGALFVKGLEHEYVRSSSFERRIGKDPSNILQKFQDTLDQSRQYMFLVRNTLDNRIVCDPPAQEDSKLFHVGSFQNGAFERESEIDLEKPNRLTFSTREDLVDYVEKVDVTKKQGVICFDRSNQPVKLLNDIYMEMFRARGNEPSVKFRYLQVRMNKKIVDTLCVLYPNMSTIFDDYEKTLYDIAQMIHRSYIMRFIKKRYVIVPKEEYQVIKECHSWYLSDPLKNRVTVNRVIQSLNRQLPTALNHMIRRYKIEGDKKEVLPRTVKSRGNSFAESPQVLSLNQPSHVPTVNI